MVFSPAFHQNYWQIHIEVSRGNVLWRGQLVGQVKPVGALYWSVCLSIVCTLSLLSVTTSIGVFYSCIYRTRLSGENLTVFFPLTRIPAFHKTNQQALKTDKEPWETL